MSKHLITPPPELVEKWAISSPIQANDENWAYELYIAHQAAHWGADQELEACCEWFLLEGWHPDHPNKLRAARRGEPPSLKEQALTLLDDASDRLDAVHENTIRRALESLPD